MRIFLATASLEEVRWATGDRVRAYSVAALAAATAMLSCDSASPSNGSAQTVSPPRASTPAIAAARRTAITDAVARVAPAVVTINTQTVERVPVDPFEAFFGGTSGERVTPSLGSGFITQNDGVIVTNAHVVSGARRVDVALRDGTTYPAQVVGVDELNDLAVLRIQAKNLPVAPLGTSRDLVIGEWAIAIGNPFGFLLGNTEPSVTAGVISGTGRNLIARAEGSGAYVDMIQTDASINPGNSGGPLVNALGEVIGVNSSIYSPSGGSIGLGFAIPIDRAKRVVEDLLTHGKVRRPWIGVQLMRTSEDPRSAVNAGAVVRTVAPGSPAASAGLQPGDVLMRSRERTIRNAFDWEAELLDLRVGETVPLRVRRGSREFDARVTVADLPEVSAPKVTVLRELELVTLTPAIRAERGYLSRRGAVVVNVSERVGDALNVEAGDLIVQVNRTAVTSADDAAKALNYFGGRGPIRMFFERGGRIWSTDFEIR